jgi:hypothetical protein
MNVAVFSTVPLSPSSFLSLQKILSLAQQVTVSLWVDEPATGLSTRLPRQMAVHVGPFDLWENIKAVPSGSVVIVLHEALLMTPEALALSVAVASSNPTCYVTFVDHTQKEASHGVIFASSRHWSVGLGASQSFAVMRDTLVADEDIFQEFQPVPSKISVWTGLEVLQRRRIFCPIPSLAAPMPLSDATNPPGIAWQSLQDFVSKTV